MPRRVKDMGEKQRKAVMAKLGGEGEGKQGQKVEQPPTLLNNNKNIGEFVPTKGVEITRVDTKFGNWVHGTVDGHEFTAKIFAESSKFGIKKGRISKLQIVRKPTPGTKTSWSLDKKNTVFNYDRGIDFTSLKGDELKEKLLKAFPKED